MNLSASRVYSPSKSTHMKSPVFTDPRLFQIAALSSFMSFGIFQLGWIQDLDRIIITLVMSMLVQALAVIGLGLKWDALKSGMITGLGLCLLFRSSNPAMWAIAPLLAIGSKYLIRTSKKHIFNPANLGVVLPILLFGDGWISPGQWGSGAVMAFFFTAAAIMVLLKVGRIDTSLAFLLTFFGLEFLRSVIYLGWELDWFMHKVTNGSILLFAFFMITDPKTTPNHNRSRLLWAALIGGASFLLSNWFYLHTAPLIVLFFAAPLMVVFDRVKKASLFKWSV